MGGKTQQRVAGNAKPANSGRIRELLVNQQQLGTPAAAGASGNIITFSALSNKKQLVQTNKQPKSKKESTQPIPLSTPPPLSQSLVQPSTPKEEQLKSADDISQDTPVISRDAEPVIVNTSGNLKSPIKENYRLVVKRVGNRDLYTRVKISDSDSQTDSLKPAVLPSEAGVKKPSYSLESSDFINKQISTNNSATQEEDDDLESELDTSSDISEDADATFDDLTDRLGELQKDCQSNEISSLDKADDKQLERALELLKVLKTIIEKYSQDLSIEDWDLVSSCIRKWTKLIATADHPLRQHDKQVDFCVGVFKFIYYLICFAENLRKQGGNLVEDFPLVQSILDDWANFHSTNVFQELLVLYFNLIALDKDSPQQQASENPSSPASNTLRPMIEELTHIVIGVDPRLVLSHYSLLDNFQTKFEFEPDFQVPDKSIFCHVDEEKHRGLLAACGLLKSHHRVVLVAAHSMLSKSLNQTICSGIIQAVIPADQLQQQNQEQIVDEEDIPILPPKAFMTLLASQDVIMSALLSDYRVGDTSVTIEPNTDAYACTMSYLFCWDLIIQYIVGVDKETGHKIIHSLKRLGFIQRLLDNVFILLPPLGEHDSLRFRIYKSAQLKGATTKLNRTSLSDHDSVAQQQQPWNLENFLKSPLRTTVKRPLNEIELIALHLYFSVSLHMPVTVRKWYNNNSNKRLCNLVNEYTVKHVSKVICSLEMDTVQDKCLERASQEHGRTNLTIKARPSAKEVYAHYDRDEFKMELTIKLPMNYPLGPVQIDGGKRVGVTDVKWRSWLLQLTTFLAHQNGPILDGIDLWRKNIDKRFEGVEKCTICFSILHSNYQLPKKKCQTCANMFHNLCLYKWFESSGNSTCPLCRNPW